MYYYHTNDEIDEIGEGLIRKYNYQAFIQGDPTDIETCDSFEGRNNHRRTNCRIGCWLEK